MKKLILIIIFTIKIFAWYPEYSIMATDFKLPYDFLKPNHFQSVKLYSYGEHFRGIHSGTIDKIFQNTGYINSLDKQYFYISLPENENDNGNGTGISPTYSMYWSLYRENLVEPNIDKPVLRLAYFGNPFKEAKTFGFGITFEQFYNKEKFYQPYWYWYGRMGYDANELAITSSSDPYADYRQVESGSNKLTQSGYKGNIFFTHALNSKVIIGYKYGFSNIGTDGEYSDFRNDTDSDYADEYQYFYDTKKDKNRNYEFDEFSTSILIKGKNKSNIGMTLGYAEGIISRDYVESDTSKYYSIYKNTPLETDDNIYHNTSKYLSEKYWIYDGHTMYGNIHGNIHLDSNKVIKYSLYGEERKASLTESEETWRRSYYYSSYWSSYHSFRDEYEHNSTMDLERSGKGDYYFLRYRGSIGINYEFAKNVKFIGGIVYDNKFDKKTAYEPFDGIKYSYRNSNDYYSGHEIKEITTIDKKKFSWIRKEKYETIAIPLGICVSIQEIFELNFGFTKVMKNTLITERYDLIVDLDSQETTTNGSTTTIVDSNYVEGYDFPDIDEFTDDYIFNAGVTFKYQDIFSITAALEESIIEPVNIRVGIGVYF